MESIDLNLILQSNEKFCDAQAEDFLNIFSNLNICSLCTCHPRYNDSKQNLNILQSNQKPCIIHDDPKNLNEAQFNEIQKILEEIKNLNNQEDKEEQLTDQQSETKNNEKTSNRELSKVATSTKSRHLRNSIHSPNKPIQYVEEILKSNRKGENYLRDLEKPYIAPNKPFQSCLNVSKFLPHELNAQVLGNEFIVTGKHEDRFENNGFIARQFTRKFSLNEKYDISKVEVCLYANGILEIKIPLKNDEKKRNY